MPDGKQLWAKSYVERSGRSIEVCDEGKWGFPVMSRMYGYGSSRDKALLYVQPYSGTFALGNYVQLNAETGEAIGAIPADFRVVDAVWLRQVKEKIWNDLKKKYPDKKITDNFDWKRMPAFFKAVEKTVFATTPTTKN